MASLKKERDPAALLKEELAREEGRKEIDEAA